MALLNKIGLKITEHEFSLEQKLSQKQRKGDQNDLPSFAGSIGLREDLFRFVGNYFIAGCISSRPFCAIFHVIRLLGGELNLYEPCTD